MADLTKATEQEVFDFTGVSDANFNPVRRTGVFKGKVVEVLVGESGAGNKQWVAKVVIGEDPSASYPWYMGLDAESAWKAFRLAEAQGLAVTKKKMRLSPSSLCKPVGVVLGDAEEYKGKTKGEIKGFVKLSEVTSAAKPASAKPKAASVDADDISDADLEGIDIPDDDVTDL